MRRRAPRSDYPLATFGVVLVQFSVPGRSLPSAFDLDTSTMYEGAAHGVSEPTATSFDLSTGDVVDPLTLCPIVETKGSRH